MGDGAFGENLVVEGIDFRSLPVGTVLECNGVVLEMTQIGKECHSHCEIFKKMGECIMPTEGVFARVIGAGRSRRATGWRCAVFRVAIVTLSDKGAAGQRTDESGAVIREIAEQNGYEVVSYTLLPDEREQISAELRRLCDENVAELVLTTGGIGFFPPRLHAGGDARRGRTAGPRHR